MTETILERDPTKLYHELHATSLAIAQARERGDAQSVALLLPHFRAVAEAYRATGAADLTATDRFILDTGAWVEKSLAVLPDAIAAGPQAIAAGLFKALWPWLAGYLLFQYLTSRRS